MAKDKGTDDKGATWKAGDLAIDAVFRNYLKVLEVDGEEAVVEHTQEGLAGVPFRLPFARLMAMPSDG